MSGDDPTRRPGRGGAKADPKPRTRPPAATPDPPDADDEPGGIGLVLGGGGARGYAHIGVLRALAERGLRPTTIAGCSAGGLVGAFLGAGYGPEELIELLREQRFETFLDLGTRGGLVGGKRFETFLAEHLPERFEALEIPLSVTAVDLQEGELVVFHSGRLVPALRASSALPGVLSPVKHRERFFLDGGLLNNLPVDVARTQTLRPVVAVDVGAPRDRELVLEDERTLWEKLRHPLVPGQRLLTLELFLKSFDVPAARMTELRLAMHPPDLLIRPPLPKDFLIEDFRRIDEGIDIGYRAATEALDGWNPH